MFDNDNGDMFSVQDLDIIKAALDKYHESTDYHRIAVDIQKYLDSLLPEKYMRVIDFGGKKTIAIANNTSMQDGYWHVKIVYNPEYLEHFGIEDTGDVFAESFFYYHVGDTEEDLKRIMDEAHNWHKDVADEEIESW